jgi:hypothetical protein
VDLETRNTVELGHTTSVSDPSSWFHPALGYAEPIDVTRDDDLTHNEKRAILAAWASDACAVKAAPALRRAPASNHTVSIDDIFAALRMLDREPCDNGFDVGWARRQTIEAGRRRSQLPDANG